ncbi:MAG: hypothetical protein CME34_02230 [Gordonia sp.]|nr:hypothetical protein [Gordonia sp. (in: high G+C Gram-positive bacteria)]
MGIVHSKGRGPHLRTMPRSSQTQTRANWVSAQTPPTDPKGTGQTKSAPRWKPALNALAITFADRMPAAEDR